MIQKLRNIAKRTVIIGAAFILAACGGDTKAAIDAAGFDEAGVETAETVKATPDAGKANIHGKAGPLVEINWDSSSLTYYELICSDLPEFFQFEAQDGSEIKAPRLTIRLTKNPDSYVRDSFSLLIQDSYETQTKWTAKNIDVEKSRDRTFKIKGTAQGKGRRLDDEGRAYRRDKSLDPKNDKPFEVSFTCNSSF